MQTAFKSLRLLILSIAVLGMAGMANAANPATINITVTIQNLSVSASGPLAFGVVAAGSETIAVDSSHVLNDGNVSEIYSLSLTDPGGWSAVSAAPGAEEYCLSAQFNSATPTALSYTYSDHALTSTPVSCSVTQFAGDQTGVTVPSGEARYLWLKFEAPSATSVTAQQTIVLTLTASAA